MSSQRPDLIDHFYAYMRQHAALTDELTRLAQQGIELAEARKVKKAARIQKRCLALQTKRETLKERWHSALRARGILKD